MTSTLILSIILGYFLLLLIISYFTSRKATDETFYTGNHKSHWLLVAIGMIGSSLSGVTFISVPGLVGTDQFSYMQTVLGYLLGYAVIAYVLMPLYYRLNLISIYTYLEKRFGNAAYKTGSIFFLISRIVGAGFRLFLVATVLQVIVFNQLGVPFYLTVIVTIALIWLYTFRGGIKTIVITDTVQALSFVLAVVITIFVIANQLGIHSFSHLVSTVSHSHYSKIFFFNDINNKMYFWKTLLGGMFIAICMTGLDQDMMQKNLSCKNIKDAQKNMVWFSVILVFVNLIFLSLGVLLYIFAHKNGIAIPKSTDELYPLIATGGYLPLFVGVLFVLGLVAAAYSSADSALTALTTSFTLDILNVKEDDPKSTKKRMMVHVGMSVVLVVTILIFNIFSDNSVILELFKAAGYTYGPLLGLYSFGLLTKYELKDRFIPYVCIIPPIICYFLDHYSKQLFNGYQFGFEILIVNGIITFLLLLLLKKKKNEKIMLNSK